MYILECSVGLGGIWVMEVCKRAERLDPGTGSEESRSGGESTE